MSLTLQDTAGADVQGGYTQLPPQSPLSFIGSTSRQSLLVAEDTAAVPPPSSADVALFVRSGMAVEPDVERALDLDLELVVMDVSQSHNSLSSIGSIGIGIGSIIRSTELTAVVTDTECTGNSSSSFTSTYFAHVDGNAEGQLAMHKHSRLVSFVINTTFRSVGQVTFADNPWSGMLIALALAIDPDAGITVPAGLIVVVCSNLLASYLLTNSPLPATCCSGSGSGRGIGSGCGSGSCSCSGSTNLGVDHPADASKSGGASADSSSSVLGAVSHGLYGFNPFLVGQSLVFFAAEGTTMWYSSKSESRNSSSNGDSSSASSSLSLFREISMLLLFLPALTVCMQMFCNHVSNKLVHGVPAFTLPFNLIMNLFLLQAYSDSFVSAFETVNTNASESGGASVVDSTGGVMSIADVNWLDATARGFGQIYFAGSTLSGALIFLAVLLYSRYAAAAGVLGSLFGVAWCAVNGMDLAAAEAGLWGYNCVLTSIALSGVFFVGAANGKSCLLWFFGLTLTAVVQGALMYQTSLPVGTLPFCVATFIILALKDTLTLASTGAAYVAASDVGMTPESLLKKYCWLCKNKGSEPYSESVLGHKRV